jgi:hypothetical protein
VEKSRKSRKIPEACMNAFFFGDEFAAKKKVFSRGEGVKRGVRSLASPKSRINRESRKMDRCPGCAGQTR